MKLLLALSLLFSLLLAVGASAMRTVGNVDTRPVRTVSSGGRVPPGWVKRRGGTQKIHQVEASPRTVQLLLKRSNMDRLEELFWDVSDPQHPSYGNHLSSDEMRQLVSPRGDEAVAIISAWLRSSGIQTHKIQVAPHQDLVTFSAGWGELEKLFPGVQSVLHVYSRSSSTGGKEKAVVASLEGFVSLPAEIAEFVEMVGGLAEFPPPSLVQETSATRLGSQAGPSATLITPQQVWAQYNLTNHMNQPRHLPQGPQQNVQAFFQMAEGINVTDLSIFCKQFHISQAGSGDECNIERAVNGNALKPSSIRLESDMDAQLLVGVGQRPTWVYTYHVGSDYCASWSQFAADVFIEKSTNTTSTSPRVISISYGVQEYPTWCDNAVDRFSDDIKKFGLMGITVLSGSGDVGSGSHSRYGSNHGHLSPGWPSQIPYMTAVGATKLTPKNQNERGDVGTGQGRAFSERATSFSGGGFSWNYSMPAYQASAVALYMSDNNGTSNITWPDRSRVQWNYRKNGVKGRATPDVTAVGSNLAIFSNGIGGWYAGAGTSASGPILGGLVSQLNNVRLVSANKTMGFINPFFYQNEDCFYDITVGNTDGGFAGTFPGLGWHAAPGWDATSGLGAPNFECLRDRILKMGK